MHLRARVECNTIYREGFECEHKADFTDPILFRKSTRKGIDLSLSVRGIHINP